MYFIVRVELHRIDSSDDYSDLHKQMQAVGFSRTIDGDDGYHYRLPPAEYYMEADFDAHEVYDLALIAVDNVLADEKLETRKANTPPSILVTASELIVWSGLSRVLKFKAKKTS